MLEKREERYLNLTEGGPLDVLVIGGGITGAPIYRMLKKDEPSIKLVSSP